MTRKSRRRRPPFFRWTAGLEHAEVIIGASLDRMLRVSVKKIPEKFDGQGEKITVLKIVVPKNGRGHFLVLLEDGTAVPEFFGVIEQPNPEITSGSTGNLAFDLRQFGVERVAVIGGVGNDIEGGKIIADLEADGIDYGLVEADQTSFTVRLREEKTGRILMLCRKGGYTLSTEISAYLASLRPSMVALTSLLQTNFSFADDLVRRLRAHRHHGKNGQGNGTFISLVPHPNLLTSSYMRPEVEKLFSELDLLIMNAHEAGLWLGGDLPANSTHPVVQLARVGAAITVVTMDAQGATVVCGKNVLQILPHHTKVVEPAGAGDAFHATLLRWQRERPLVQGSRLLRAANEASFAAAHKVGCHGPWSVPSLQRIKNFRRYGAKQ